MHLGWASGALGTPATQHNGKLAWIERKWSSEIFDFGIKRVMTLNHPHSLCDVATLLVACACAVALHAFVATVMVAFAPT